MLLSSEAQKIEIAESSEMLEEEQEETESKLNQGNE